MMTKGRWRGPGGRAGLLVLMAALTPLPVAASEAAPAQSTPTVKTTSLHDAVAREAARAAQTPMASATTARRDQGNAAKSTMAFFKTGPGMVALTVMAVGTGYAVYSLNHDKVTSPGRK